MSITDKPFDNHIALSLSLKGGIVIVDENLLGGGGGGSNRCMFCNAYMNA